MKKLWTLIVVIIMVVGMQLPAEGTAEAIRYTKDIIGKTDSVSLYLQNIAKSHAIESGPLKIQILPMSSETYVFSAYPDMRARRYDYGQMKEQVLSLVRHMDDYWNAERLIDRTFIMIMRYERDDNISGPDSFMIDEEFFDYVFLDNDKGNFMRVYEHSLGEPFILDEHNDVFAVMVSFGRTRLDYELLTFLQEAKSFSISINAFGLEGLSIEFEIPLEKLYYDMPDGPKKFLERIRSDLTVSFHGTIEVFATPLRERATAIIIAHNHPSGILKPSTEDLSVTKRLVKAGDLLGIKVLDHLIFSDEGYRSMLEKDEMG
jgi:hypothetical protein